MSYPETLDEVPESRLREELRLRERRRLSGRCDYCGGLYTETPCRFPGRHRALPGRLNQTPAILEEILQERRRQDAKWGGPDHDDTKTVWDWAHFILDRANGLSLMLEGSKNMNWGQARTWLLHIAALAVAAMESIDRRCNRPADQETKP